MKVLKSSLFVIHMLWNIQALNISNTAMSRRIHSNSFKRLKLPFNKANDRSITTGVLESFLL
jgi:hypothetical protein